MIQGSISLFFILPKFITKYTWGRLNLLSYERAYEAANAPEETECFYKTMLSFRYPNLPLLNIQHAHNGDTFWEKIKTNFLQNADFSKPIIAYFLFPSNAF